MVYILNHNIQPLMPTKDHRKVRLLLKQNKAVVVRRTPFTVMLLHPTHEYRQDITLGVDAGSKVVGMSAVTSDVEVYASETTLRTDITDLLASRRQFRRSRRSRKTRYRKARFGNRVAAKKKGWLAPGIRNKIDSHLKLVDDVHKILPISKIIVEVASFDIQKIRDPEISGSDYQKGVQLDFWNVREYVFYRDHHTCQHCNGKSKDKVLNVHHLESRKTGGDSPENLLTLCETCHNAYHKGGITLKIKRGASFRDAAFMGIMRWAFYNRLVEGYPDVSFTYGYITKNTRIENGLPKSHSVDARCISGHPGVKPLKDYYRQKFVRKNNRSLHKANPKKGIRKRNQAPRYVFGYQLYDKVLYGSNKGQECFVFGRRSSGYFDIRQLDGSHVHKSANYRKLKLLESRKTLLTERGAGRDLLNRIPLPPIEVGVSC